MKMIVPEDAGDCGRFSDPHLEQQAASVPERTGRTGNQPAIQGKSVRAAVQGKQGLAQHFRLEIFTVAGRNVGRITGDQIKGIRRYSVRQVPQVKICRYT